MTDAKPEDKRILIRSSSIGAVACCIRHFAASRDTESLVLAHPDVVNTRRSGGYKSPAGTAFHKCMEDNLKSSKAIRAVAEETFKQPSQDEDFFDERWTSTEMLSEMVEKMVFAFRKSKHSAEWTIKRRGNKYEQHLTSKEIDSGILLSGHIDCIRKDGTALDLKTGVTTDMNLYQEQLTAYRLLVEHNVGKAKPNAEVVKVSRPISPKSKVPITAKRYRVDTRIHEHRVIDLVKKAAEVVAYSEQWSEDFTKLPANPASRACAYCQLKNTSACPETQRLEIE